MKNKKLSEICYKYKDGRFLKVSEMGGDGEYELILTKNLTSDCLFEKSCSLSDVLNFSEGVYDDYGNFISDTLDKLDFVSHDAEIKIN